MLNTEQVWRGPWVDVRNGRHVEQPMLTLKDESARPRTRPGVFFTAEDRELIERCGLRESVVRSHMPSPSSGAAREAVRLRAAEMAGPLTESEVVEMGRLKASAVSGWLDHDGQGRLLALLDRSLAHRGGGR